MNTKFKRDALSGSETSNEEDRIVLKLADSATSMDSSTPMAQLETMEHYARAKLSLQTVSSALDVLRPPQGAYVHYIPQFYLH